MTHSNFNKGKWGGFSLLHSTDNQPCDKAIDSAYLRDCGGKKNLKIGFEPHQHNQSPPNDLVR